MCLWTVAAISKSVPRCLPLVLSVHLVKSIDDIYSQLDHLRNTTRQQCSASVLLNNHICNRGIHENICLYIIVRPEINVPWSTSTPTYTQFSVGLLSGGSLLTLLGK